MKMIILVLALMLGFSTNVWSAVQTDTHTYIVSTNDNAVLAINRQTGLETRITVGVYPESMVIHGDRGYVVNYGSNDVSVIDLNSNTVTQTIAVGRWPTTMVIHGEKGYVTNYKSDNVSVIDLRSNTVTQTIAAGNTPQSMVIHGGIGYVLNQDRNCISVIDLTSNKVTEIIPVDHYPQSMVIHGEKGYVVNYWSDSVSVVDFKTNKVILTIPVGNRPRTMVIHGEKGYVVNFNSEDVSIIDLQKNTVIQTISVKDKPSSMVINGEMGYIKYYSLDTYTVIDLKTNSVVTNFDTNKSIDFSDTHVYLGLKKARPLYPTLASINRAKEQNTLGEFVAMMPKVFKLGEINQRAFAKEENVFDTLPVYLLAQNIFWDLKTGLPLMDPEDILATLITMKYPQRFLKTEAGAWLRKRLHMAFFQTVWMGDKDKAKTMLKYFVQLQDPVIPNLATYTFKAVKKSSDQKATNSMDLD